ncbi:MAG: helix-turn-helix domain-containing protein [Candidatus Cybelea sp.]
MRGRLSDLSFETGAAETPREALGRFLRKRRESIIPQDVGILSRRGRRTPGLRREEVAFLADIGVKWYARLEAGDDIHPSESTLTGIATALNLSAAEFEYMLELAGLRRSLPSEVEVNTTIPEPIPALLDSLRGVAATVGDKILTPLRWNALADAIYAHSRYQHPVERNALVRCIFDHDFISLLGAAREELFLHAVGMFRLNYSSQRPSPFAEAVYERIKDEPAFLQAWNRRLVAGEFSNENAAVRNHAVVGRLLVYAIEFNASMRPDLIFRTLVPADRETAEKFRLLESLAQNRPPSIARRESHVGRSMEPRA